MPWLRLWDDALDSPKVHRLKPDLFRAWIFFLLAAKRHNCNGILPDIETIAFWMHASEPQVEAWIGGLMTAGLIEDTEHGTAMHDWETWQQPPDKTAAQRMRKMRAARRAKKAEKSDPPPDPPSEQRREEKRGEDVTPPVTGSVTTEVLQRNTSVTHETDSAAAREVVAEAVRLWGQIDLDADTQAREMIRAYGAEVAGAALKKAYRKVGSKQRPWAYAWTVAQDGPSILSAKPGAAEVEFTKAPPDWNGKRKAAP